MTPLLEVIFVTLTENSSAKTNDTQWLSSDQEISTSPKIAVETHVHAQYGTKTTTLFLLPSLSLYYKAVQCNQKTPIPVS